MNNSRLLLTIFTNYRQNALKSIRNFHSAQVLCQQQHPNIYSDSPEIDSSLFFTNLPNKRREKKVKEVRRLALGKLVIKCKHRELDHYSGMHYGKFDVIPLASKGWAHRKSRGDHFTILPTEKYSPFLTKEGLPDTFEGCGISEEVIQQLKKIKVTKPTAIQAKVLEKLLSGENVLMFAECGSGKTLGYVLAMIENILKWKRNVPPDALNSPLGIIVTASGELAVQVMRLASSLSSDLGLNCQALIDGYSRELIQNPQMAPVDILVCTVSVAIRQFSRRIYSTKYCKHVVIDDADFFEIEEKFEDIQDFLNVLKLKFTGLNVEGNDERRTQICFVSAVAPSTLKGKLNDIIQMSDVPVVSTPYLHKVLHTVPQHFMRVTGANLAQEFLKIAKSNTKNKIPTIIFSNLNKTCNWAAFFLKENNVECVTVNKKDPPSKRMENFRNFELGFVNIICTTNLLSLGLHLPQVKHVLSLEFPRYMSDYIHRCGRVGRLGQVDGCLITNFIKRPRDIELVQKIEKAVRTNTVLPTIYTPRVRSS